MEVREGVCVRGCSAQTSQRGEDPPMYGMCEWQPAESAKRGVNGNQVNGHWVTVELRRSTAIGVSGKEGNHILYCVAPPRGQPA